MAKLDYMPLYVKDIVADDFCLKLDDAAFGQYIRLLMLQWRSGSVPGNPEDAKFLAHIRGDVTTVKALLHEKFTIDAGDGTLRNHRCHTVRQDVTARVEANQKNGRRGGRPASQDTDDAGFDPAEVPDAVSGSELDTPEFAEAWVQWCQHRREKRQKLTPTAVSKQAKLLLKMGHDRAVAAIHHSIAQGWTGIFEEKRNGVNHGRPLKGTDIERRENAHVRPDLKAA